MVTYLSRPFARHKLADLGTDWSDFIRARYHLPSTMNGSCMANLGRYEASRRALEARKNKIIDVDWQE